MLLQYGTRIVSNLASERWPHLNHNHDEADTLIVCILRELLHPDQSKARIISPDTDVLMLLVEYAATVCPSNRLITFELLSSNSRRDISVNQVVQSLDSSISLGLMSAFVYTGCDHVGKFNSITKCRVFNVFLEYPDDVINELQRLGESFTDISDTAMNALVQYTMLLYAKNKAEANYVAECTDTGDLRSLMFSKDQKESENLPPTPGALKYHIKRANFVCGLWKQLILSFNVITPDISDHGWE